MANEADTCRKYVVPLLQAAGWDDDPHRINEQVTFTDGRVLLAGSQVRRGAQRRADYVLRHSRDLPLAVVEAKAGYKLPGDGLQQAKQYAEALDLKFAYATNGHGIVEFDYLTGVERELGAFPTPQELWVRQYGRSGLAATFEFRSELIWPHDGSTGHIRFVGLQHIESHTGRKLGEDYMQGEELPGRKFRFEPGDIVYGYLRPYLNKVWVADCEGYCSVDQYVLIPRSEQIDTEYLARYLRSELFLKQAIKLTHNLMLPRLRSGLFGNITIPIVALEEQRSIVVCLDRLHGKLAQVTVLQLQTAAELDALLPAVLDRAFRGSCEQEEATSTHEPKNAIE